MNREIEYRVKSLALALALHARRGSIGSSPHFKPNEIVRCHEARPLGGSYHENILLYGKHEKKKHSSSGLYDAHVTNERYSTTQPDMSSYAFVAKGILGNLAKHASKNMEVLL